MATPQFIKDHLIEKISDLADVPWIGHSLLNWQDSQYILQNSLGSNIHYLLFAVSMNQTRLL